MDGKFAAVEGDDGRCHVPGCDGVRGCKPNGKFITPVGLCNKHYLRLRRYGAVDGGPSPRPAKPPKPPKPMKSKRYAECGCIFVLPADRRIHLCPEHKSNVVSKWEAKQEMIRAHVKRRQGERDLLLDLHAQGLDSHQIAEEMGMGVAHLQAVACYRGVQLRNPPRGVPFTCRYAPVSKIAETVVMPGIDKHLIPVLAYRGNWNIGRAHRFWNFVLAMRDQECENINNAIKLSHHPDYSHLCGPEHKISHMGLYGFLSRLGANPRVTDNIPGLTDYVRSIGGWRFDHMPVSLETRRRDAAPWRLYVPGPRGRKHGAQRISAKDVIYPYIMHDGKTDAGVDMVKEVNRIVPRGLPEEFRADVCQDIICAVLAGEVTLAELEGADVRKFVATARNIFASKWDHFSLDDTYEEGGNSFLDTFNFEERAAVH